MPASSYESLTVFPGWDECDDSCIERIQGLMAPKCAVFLVVEGNQVMNAADFLFKLTQVDHGAYVFKLWQRQTTKKAPKTVRQGPRGCVIADTVQIWTLETNRVEMHGGRTFQTVVAQKPTTVMDHIADHVNTNDRVVVLFGDDYQPAVQVGSTEFDIFSVTEDKVVKRKVFSATSARKSRMFKAYIETHDAKQLAQDRKALAENAEEANVLAGMIKDSELEPATLDKMLKSAIAKKRRLEKKKDTTAPKKERSPNTSGIAAVCQVTEALRDFLVEHCEITVPPEGIARTEVVRAIPKYIKRNNLSEGRKVTLDDNLRTLMRQDDIEGQEITFFTIYKFINHNFIKKEKAKPKPETEVKVPTVKVPEPKVPEPKVPKKRKAAATQKGQAKKAKSK